MTKSSVSSAKSEKKIDFELVEKLINNIKNSRDKEIFSLILNTASKTKKISKKLNLSPRRIQQIITQYTVKEFNQKLLPKDIRNIAIEHKFNQNKSIKKTQKESRLKNIRCKEYLEEKQLKKIQTNITNKEHQLIFETLIQTGCTLTELTNIKKTDVQKDTIKIGERKTNISSELSKRLRETKSEFVFYTRQSPKISDKRVFQIIKDYAKKSGLKTASPQIIRNTYVVNALKKGISKTKISEQTGIKNLSLNHFGLAKGVKNE